eukprot:363484-Chlamydomonas_euryale.AAC.8
MCEPEAQSGRVESTGARVTPVAILLERPQQPWPQHVHLLKRLDRLAKQRCAGQQQRTLCAPHDVRNKLRGADCGGEAFGLQGTRDGLGWGKKCGWEAGKGIDQWPRRLCGPGHRRKWRGPRGSAGIETEVEGAQKIGWNRDGTEREVLKEGIIGSFERIIGEQENTRAPCGLHSPASTPSSTLWPGSPPTPTWPAAGSTLDQGTN